MKSYLLSTRAPATTLTLRADFATVMSGLRPDSISVWNFMDDFRQANTSTVSMPQYFKQQGYITLGQGKTFHNEMPPRWDQPFSWTEPGSVPGLSTDYCGACTPRSQKYLKFSHPSSLRNKRSFLLAMLIRCYLC
jgi:hypothetical protein